MHFTIEKLGESVVMGLIHRLDTNNAPLLESALKDFAEGSFLIIDFSKCNYISSAGIRVLIKAHKKLLNSRGSLYLSSVPTEVMQVFEMTGLHHVFHFETDVANSIKKSKLFIRSDPNEKISWNGMQIFATYSDHYDTCLKQWTNKGMASISELGLSVGFGKLPDRFDAAELEDHFFITSGRCAGFLPPSSDLLPDFTVAADPDNTAILFNDACSFGKIPYAGLRTESPLGFNINSLPQLVSSSLQVKGLSAPKAWIMLLKAKSSSSNCLYIVASLSEQLQAYEGNQLMGGAYMLEEMSEDTFTINSIQLWLDQHLTIENIIDFTPLPDKIDAEAFSGILYIANEIIDASDLQLKIQCEGNSTLNVYQSYLIRKLYTDSSKIAIKPLHGGFSAQTYQIISFDEEGRKLRPTVLKIAKRDIIARESERCKTFALPYIFNNSAVVLGAVFTGEWGALRYNFVGIGGEETQLQWLANYFEEHASHELEPLLDKIFLQILKPWYGQTVIKNLFLFKEHDPTFTFFGHIYHVASEVWNITADDQYMHINEKEYLNPYWYLKHVYNKHRNYSFSYPTAICHGDLNLQNILLDESMNVYLIDFSETRPRAAIADFARIEAIMMIDRADVEDTSNWATYANFLEEFYGKEILSLETLPAAEWIGNDNEGFRKQMFVTRKMRHYAKLTVPNHSMIFPYYIALLEWILPVICYTISLPRRRMATVAASIICQRLTESGFD